MASDWSWNVWALGLTGVLHTRFISKAARRLNVFGRQQAITNATSGPNQAVVYLLPDAGDPYGYVETAVFKLAPRFPFGYPVEPDLHT